MRRENEVQRKSVTETLAEMVKFVNDNQGVKETRPEVVNRCDSRFVTGFKTEFVTRVLTRLLMVFMT